MSDYIKQKHNIVIKLFNIGGGVGIPEVHFYTLFDLMFNTFTRIFKKRRQYDIKNFNQKKMLDEIVKYLNKKFNLKEEYPEIMMEPGRALIGNTIDLNTKVVNIKKTNSAKSKITGDFLFKKKDKKEASDKDERPEVVNKEAIA